MKGLRGVKRDYCKAKTYKEIIWVCSRPVLGPRTAPSQSQQNPFSWEAESGNPTTRLWRHPTFNHIRHLVPKDNGRQDCNPTTSIINHTVTFSGEKHKRSSQPPPSVPCRRRSERVASSDTNHVFTLSLRWYFSQNQIHQLDGTMAGRVWPGPPSPAHQISRGPSPRRNLFLPILSCRSFHPPPAFPRFFCVT